LDCLFGCGFDRVLNKTASNISATTTQNQGNSFSRNDDRARLLQFKEIDAFDRNIEALLIEAQELVDSLSYTVPEERNAVLVYREILELSPNNIDAQQGIIDISDKLLEIGERALSNNKLSTANRTLQKLLNIDQESEQTIRLTSAISNWHEEKKVTDLIIAGNRAFEQKDYISPATKNALYYYERALALDINNQSAKRGIAKIIAIFRQRTEEAINAEQYNIASTNLEILTEVDPSDSKIPEFQNAILQALTEQQRALNEKIGSE